MNPKPVMIRLEEEDLEELEELADDQQVPVAVYIRRLVERHLKSKRSRQQ
jgi:predicted DNA-binding protein